MKTGVIALVLLGTLSACGSTNREDLPVRNGPQTQDPHEIGEAPGPANNCTINCTGVVNIAG